MPYPASDSEVDISEWEWTDAYIEDDVIRDGPLPHTPQGSQAAPSLEANDEHDASVFVGESEERHDIVPGQDIPSEVRRLLYCYLRDHSLIRFLLSPSMNLRIMHL